MTRDDYFPADNTLPARVVAYLHSLPRGTEIGTGTIAQALDAEIAAVFAASGAAIKAGLIANEKVGARYFWTRGERDVPREFVEKHPPRRHVELPPPTTMRERLVKPRVIDSEEPGNVVVFAGPDAKARIAEPAPESAQRAAVPEASPPPAPVAAPAPAAKSRAPIDIARPMRIGIYSDGSLVVERSGRIESFNPDEVTQLVRFLDRMLLKGGSVA